MGRELKRKEAKKNGRSVHEVSGKEMIDSGVKTLPALKITIVVLSLLAILYLILAIFVTKELNLKKDKEETEETEGSTTSSVSNAILAASIFKQSEETYYVLFYGFDDEDDSEIASSVTNGLTDYKVYKVDTDSGMNKNYVDENSNPSATSLSDLKVKSPTLIEISADAITLYVEGEDNIESYLAK